MARVRMDKLDSSAYEAAFHSIFTHTKKNHPEFDVGKTLKGIVADWSDTQMNGLKLACVYLFTIVKRACLHLFTHVYSYYSYYWCLPMFTRVYLCLFVFTYVYHCLLVFSHVFNTLLVLVYLCILMFNHVYLCLLVFTSCLPMFTTVYLCLLIFHYFYSCLFTYVYTS